ncbi:MAG: class I SAM-dependent methyltransferase [Paracoccaceae bacterium]|nr:class I SAM-dependent methyltransferase [Paracoccaceae bacterium]
MATTSLGSGQAGSKEFNDAIEKGAEAEKNGQWREARAHFMSALQIDNQAADVWVRFGHVVEKGATATEAEKAYRRALTLDPTNTEIKRDIGRAIKLQGRETEAYAYLRSIAASAPGNEAVINDLKEIDTLAAARADTGLKRLQAYRGNGFDDVQGWCLPRLFDIFSFFEQLEFNREGGALEIGVHHGKFFLLMNQLIDPQYNSYAIDVFEDQALNIDKSGLGDSNRFERNLKLYDSNKGRNTDIIKGDSTDPLLGLKGRIGHGAIRFLSVDGGHTAEHAISDLELAIDLISNEGVVIVDDILNPHWLGVIAGVFRYLDRQPTLVPFAIGENKLFMCKISFQQAYLSALTHRSNLTAKRVDFFGHSIALL